MHLAVAALENPFQHAAVFAITRPQKFFLIFILAKPIYIKQLRKFRSATLRPHFDPVRQVIAHVVATERKHCHRVAAELPHFSGDGSSGLTAHRRPQKRSMLPVKSFSDEGDNSRASSPEQDGI